MNPAITPSAPAPVSAGFWSQFRDTFGPALVGFLGGGLSIGVGYTAMATLLRNAANTYASFPSLTPPWLARDIRIPVVLQILLVVLGVLAPLGMGLATARLVRSKGRWNEVSAGLTTAFTASLAAYVLWIGWAVTLATTVVPSISDLTLFGDATRAPAVATGAPSDVLAERYPDLKDVPADERGARFFAKIVSDQVVGGASGIWLGIGFSLATFGLLGFCGTLAGGWLLRRGGSARSIIVPYFELTVSTSVATGVLICTAIGLRDTLNGFGAICAVAATALVVAGVINRWGWLLRVASALTWVLVLSGAGLDTRMPEAVTLVAYLAYSILGVLLFRHWFFHSRRPVGAVA